jgi:hypothetical protein
LQLGQKGGVLYLNQESRQKRAGISRVVDLRNPEEKPTKQTVAQMITLRVDFISRPDNKCEIAAEVGDLLAEAHLYQKGLKAGMILVSDREARLVTLLTLWDGERFDAARERLTTWTLKIVSQFAEGPLHARTSLAHFLLPTECTKLTLSDLRPAEIAELVEIVAPG